MQRKARADVKLSNGTVIPKGGFLAVSTHRHWYGHRFLLPMTKSEILTEGEGTMQCTQTPANVSNLLDSVSPTTSILFCFTHVKYVG